MPSGKGSKPQERYITTYDNEQVHKNTVSSKKTGQ
jgi:hypothetical protein